MENDSLSLYLMSLLYITAGIFHFITPKFYIGIMPKWLPYQHQLVFLSGLIEIGLGLLLLFDQTRKFAAWSTVAMLISFLPIHFHMLSERKTTFKKYPALFLWLRPGLQVLLAYWAFLFTS